ncbi:carbonic anhydrase [Neisseriaceae bacterium PsAf]|nr:carbonic anhydrase [Neisseriaceae bacterium PsAf]MCV2502799.1 carbonic anhydrase [Neisseriaceae bacterium]
MSNLLSEIIEHNHQFVISGSYSNFFTDKYPNRNLAILSCMDARMTELLPNAMGIKNGDAKLIKNAGALVLHPWGSVMSSLLIAVYELHVYEIMVVAHHDCGAKGMKAEKILEKALENGIKQETIDVIKNSGIDLDTCLEGFDSVEDSVIHTTNMIKNHPLMPNHIKVHGLVIHPSTGQLTVIKEDL